MRCSTDRILRTHVGALPAPHDVWANTEVSDGRLREAVAEVVPKQRESGVEFVNEGELSEGGHWVEYLPTRHSTPLVEQPQLVADRILRLASLVGRENVIASTDCGLGLRVHPSLAWAKLRALTEGARIASEALW